MRRWVPALAVLVVFGCTRSKPSAAPTRAAPSTPGFTTCGDFGLRATTADAMLPLLSCAGLANVNPLPWTRIRVGEKLRVWFDESGARVVLHAGSTLVTIAGWSCAELIGPPPQLCPLMRLTVG